MSAVLVACAAVTAAGAVGVYLKMRTTTPQPAAAPELVETVS
jgi:hypothetical protein